MSHGRLAFCSATKTLLAFISPAAGSTDTTSRKSAIKEKMIWKVTLCSALIFFCKRYLQDERHFFSLFSSVRSASFSDGGSRDCSWHNIQRSNASCSLFFGYVVKFHARARILAIEFVCFLSFFLFFSFLFLFLPTFSIFSPLPLPFLYHVSKASSS